MNRIGVTGKYNNQQIRSFVITAGLETGMNDNEIKAITGQRADVSLEPYKGPSLKWRRKSKIRMMGSISNAGSSWCDTPDFDAIERKPFKEPQLVKSISVQTAELNDSLPPQVQVPRFGKRRRQPTLNIEGTQHQLPVSQNNTISSSQNQQLQVPRFGKSRRQAMLHFDSKEVDNSRKTQNKNIGQRLRFGRNPNWPNFESQRNIIFPSQNTSTNVHN